MLTIKLNYPEIWKWPAERQTPGRTAVWGDCRFLINQPVKQCDYWVVFEDLDEPEATHCPAGNTLLVTGEPPTIREYSKKFVNQFSTAITCHPDLPCSEVLLTQQALPWHVGRREASWDGGYDELKSLDKVEKSKLLSVISSDKAFTSGHRRRRRFVARLQEHFGDRLEVFGRGVRDVEDKWDALAPYKYHLALENSSYPHYWTEKLSDTYLAHSFPIYGGCPNVNEYFPNESFCLIDMDDPESAIERIEECLEKDLWERSREARAQARQLVLDKYNFFPMVADFVEKRIGLTESKPVRVRLRPDETLVHRFLKNWKKLRRRI